MDAGTERVALVHDWLTGMRGGERVLESLCRMFPQADLLTLVHVPGSVSPIIERLRSEITKALPDLRERFQTSGGDVLEIAPDQLIPFVKSEHDKWIAIIREAGIEVRVGDQSENRQGPRPRRASSSEA